MNKIRIVNIKIDFELMNHNQELANVTLTASQVRDCGLWAHEPTKIEIKFLSNNSMKSSWCAKNSLCTLR